MNILILTLALQFAAVVSSSGAAAKKSTFTFDDIYNDVYYPKSFNPKWVKDKDEFTYVNSDGDFVKYEIKNKKEKLIVSHLRRAKVHYLSPNGTHVLLGYNRTKLWRHSFYADYEILDLVKNTTKKLGKRLLYANWGNTGDYLSFVLNNNLYIHKLGEESFKNLTSDGSDVIINGAPNWLYEEDVLSSRVAHFWSPDDEYLCFAKFDDLKVPKQHWPKYGHRSKTYEDLIYISYPKAGLIDGRLGNNTDAQLFVVKIKENSTNVVELKAPADMEDERKYFLQAVWKNTNEIIVTWVNRRQDTLVKMLYYVTENRSVEIYRREVRNGWIDNDQEVPIFVNNSHFIVIEPHTMTFHGKNETWRHPIKIWLQNANRPEFILKTKEEVSKLIGFDTSKDVLYFITTNGNSGERHVGKYELLTGNRECLTCDNPKCKFASASFSQSAEYYLLNCLGPQAPTSTLMKVESNKVEKKFEENKKFSDAINLKLIPSKHFYQVDNLDYKINIELYVPANKKKGEKFPLLIFTYAGPGTQETSEKLDMGSRVKHWLLHLSSHHRIAVASIDGRGSEGNGEDLKFKIYKKLGVVEVEDQITGVKFLEKNVQWIDARKPTAIFGWSYGGQTAALALADDKNVFQCALSVAPVTYQALYDTAYVERYLGLATEENGTAYENTDIMRKIKNFKNKKFLIAHGLADDNVHYSNFAYLVKELENNEVKFTQLTYPDEDHSISTYGMSRHLFGSMTDFIKACHSDKSLYKGSASTIHSTLMITLVINAYYKLLMINSYY